jgi:hypothetical protein
MSTAPRGLVIMYILTVNVGMNSRNTQYSSISVTQIITYLAH